MSGPVDFDALYEAFNARDIEAALARLHPEVRWPKGWEGGEVHGRDAVRAYWLRQWAAIDPKVTPLGSMLESDGRTAVTMHQLVRDLDGAVLSRGEVVHVYLLEDGLILSMEIRSHGG